MYSDPSLIGAIRSKNSSGKVWLKLKSLCISFFPRCHRNVIYIKHFMWVVKVKIGQLTGAML